MKALNSEKNIKDSGDKNMRQKIYRIVEVADSDDNVSRVYDIFMMVVIFTSLLPLAFKEVYDIFRWIDRIALIIFIIDYIFRFITADLKLQKGIKSFFIYPFTFMAIIDLIAILPSITMLNSGFKLLKISRLTRTFRVFRVFKAVRYSKNLMMLTEVFKKQKDSLVVVLWLAVAYIVISALVIFNVEPNTFENFFDAIYWATVSLTTVGYGDIYAVSTAGQIITMISAIMGIAVVALPASIITAGYMDMLNEQEEEKKKQKKKKKKNAKEDKNKIEK